MEYYGLDVHKLSITYTCMTEEGKVQSPRWPPKVGTAVGDSGGAMVPKRERV